jgi:Tol biopolymer transport system component
MLKIYQLVFAILFLAFGVIIAQQDFPDTPEILGEGTISTGEYETHPAFTPTGDTLYFLKCLPDAQFCSICISINYNGKWSAPEIASFSGRYLDVDPFVTKDGNTIYFVSNRPIKKDEPVKKDWDIWKTERTTSGWGKPIHLDSHINSDADEYYPTLADNGNLYFGSSREGGKGRADLYVSKYIDNNFSTSENLGDSLNTESNEYEPYISPDETYVIFMRTPNSVANSDFYLSRKVNDKWSKAIKLPEPINSSAVEWGGKVTRDGKYFVFGSTRKEISDELPEHENMKQFSERLNSTGNGLGDIYIIKLSTFYKSFN